MPDAHTRLDRALDRMAAVVGDALGPLADGDGWEASAFLRGLGDGAASDEQGGLHAWGDGACLDLPSGGHLEPVDRLVATLALGPTEIDLLLLAALPHHHEGVAAVFRNLHPDGWPWPTVGLAAHVAEQGGLGGGRELGAYPRPGLRALITEGTLGRTGALVTEGDAPQADRSLRLAAGLWEALVGEDTWPPGVLPSPRPLPVWGLAGWLAEPSVETAARAISTGAEVVVAIEGDRPDASATRLGALVETTGAEPVLLEVAALDDLTMGATMLAALARGVVPVVWARQTPAGPLRFAPVRAPIALAVPAGSDLAAWPRPVVMVPNRPLDAPSRLAAQQAAFPGIEAGAHPLGPATLEPSDLAMVAADLATRAALGDRIDRREVARSIDGRTADTVPVGAVLVHPRVGWADLVIAPDRRAQLQEAVARVHFQEVVFDDWGVLDGRPGRRGLRMLFCGPPGTGKTLAAEVLAATLGRDLLVVDLSRMVSKWIGETEKNLAATFEAAERSGATLLFDEADALFGKRTEVGDARDRYANLETAYLLARLERFDGLAILATNLRKNLDGAFARRLEFIVPFDLPDAEAREAIWRRHLASRAPVDGTVDPTLLASLYELPGALIRNAAVAAAFLAASGPEGPTSLTIGHVVHAVRREYVKAGLRFPGAPRGVALPNDSVLTA